MGQTPDEIRAQIEQTRAELTGDVNVLADKVSPGKVAQRRVESAKQSVTSVKERIVGAAHDKADSLSPSSSASGGRAGEVASSATDTVKGAPTQVKAQAQGSPLAAGLIAFGVGALAAAVFPATQKEQDATARISEQMAPALESVKSSATSAAADVKENLQPMAQDAAASVKATAQDAVAATSDHAKDAGASVKDEAAGSASTVAQHATEAKDAVTQHASEAKDAVAEPAKPSGSSSV